MRPSDLRVKRPLAKQHHSATCDVAERMALAAHLAAGQDGLTPNRQIGRMVGPTMEYRTLGRTGVRISPLTFGTMQLHELPDEASAGRLLDAALDAGINSVDTANVYGRGASEERLGTLLRANGRRERLIVASKVHARMDDTDPNAAGSSRRHIVDQCHASLRRLQVDHLDVYYLHRPTSQVPIDESLRALDDLVRAGTVRYIGTSSFAAWQVVESLWASKELHLERVVAEQTPYSLVDRRVERELLPMAQSYGLGITVWSPLAGGLLTGKYRTDNWPADSRFGGDPTSSWARRHFTDRSAAVVDAILAIAERKGCTAAQVAIAWTLRHPAVSSVVLGVRNISQLEDQLAAVDVLLSEQDLAFLDGVSTPGRAVVPYYLDDDFADWNASRFRW